MGKKIKKDTEVIKIRLSISENNSGLSAAEGNTSGPLNTASIADLTLPL